MRLAQLPEPIKMYLRERQQAESKRVKKDRTADGAAGNLVRSSGGKRKRSEEDSPARASGSGEALPQRAGAVGENGMTIQLDARFAGMMPSVSGYSHLIDPQLTGHAPPLSAGQDHSIEQHGLQAQDQHQQILALIPAPSVGRDSGGGGYAHDQATPIDGSEVISEAPGMESTLSSTAAAMRWRHIGQQQVQPSNPLSDLRTSTADTTTTTVMEPDQIVFPEPQDQS
jgi:hypothetical protein